MTTNAPMIATAGLLGVTAVSLAQIGIAHRHKSHRTEYRSVLAAMRWWMLPAALLVLTAVGLTTAALWQIPVLRASWWWLISGTPGSAALGQTGYTGAGWTALAVFLPIATLLLIPKLALVEERIFRTDSENRTAGKNFLYQAAFGLMHSALAGVPIAAGLALIGSGYYFMWVYLKHVDRAACIEHIQAEAERESVWDREVGQLDHATAIDRIVNHPQGLDRLHALKQNIEQRSKHADAIENLQNQGIHAAAAAHAVYNLIPVTILVLWLTAHHLGAF